MDEEISLSETTQGIKSPGDDGTCPEWGCGSNSPKVEAADFHELHERGLPNSKGYRVTAFQKEYPAGSGIWRSYDPDVQTGRIRAISRADHTTVVWSANADIRGMRLVLENARGLVIHIYIRNINSAPMWAHPPGTGFAAVGRSATTYELRWQYPDRVMHQIAVCGATADDDGIVPFNAVLFEDDRIDADALRVMTDVNSDWFNIGCQGHTLAKMHLMGHTKAGSAIVSSTTTIAERTTLLKMLSGDYCGQGDPFTVAGAPLNWKDNRGWYNDVPSNNAYFDIEARWGENGALCLNVPRIDFHGGDPAFPGGVEALLQPSAGWCTEAKGNLRPPPCLGDDVSNFWGGHLISANVIY